MWISYRGIDGGEVFLGISGGAAYPPPVRFGYMYMKYDSVEIILDWMMPYVTIPDENE